MLWNNSPSRTTLGIWLLGGVGEWLKQGLWPRMGGGAPGAPAVKIEQRQVGKPLHVRLHISGCQRNLPPRRGYQTYYGD